MRELQWYREYLYRRIFPMTHEEYLNDSSAHEVEWMLRIHALVTAQKNRDKAERRRRKAEQQRS